MVEENPAPLVFGRQQLGLEAPAPVVSGDDTPIGVSLRQLVILDESDGAQDVPDWRFPGVDLSRAGAFLRTDGFRKRMAVFVGKELSQRLLEDIRVEIVKYYRARGHPFVSVVAPPQEVTGGELILKVIEFKAGKVTTEGNEWTPDGYILRNVRQEPGDDIDASRLIDDVNWLNLNPYRNLGAVFEPGVVTGTTDITLRSDERRPWTVYAGYANSGTASTGHDRMFMGGNVANLPFLDHQISYLTTLNPESFGYGDMLHVTHAPGYASHAASYFAPLEIADAVRSKLQLTAGYVESGSVLNPFFDEFSKSWALTSELAFPVRVPGARQFDVFAGFDAKRQFSDIVFADTVVAKTADSVGQFRLGARGRFGVSAGPIASDGFFEAYTVLSPSSLVSDSIDYTYFHGTVEQVARLRNGFGLSTSLTGQLSANGLPDLEKFAIGGSGSVRGYSTNELSGDSGLFGSLELRSPVFRHELKGSLDLAAEGYLFFDAGLVRSKGVAERGLQSVGAGIDIGIGQYLTASLEAGHALSGADDTRTGETSVFGTFVIRY